MKQSPPRATAILFILAAIANNASPATALIGIQSRTNPPRHSSVTSRHEHPATIVPPPPSSSTSLDMTGAGGLFASASEAIAPFFTPMVRRMLLVLGAAYLVLTKRLNKILYPGALPDPGSDAPLPPGSFGCPFLGSNILAGSTEYGPNEFFNKARKRLGNPSIYKFFAFGAPMVSISGQDNIKGVLEDEFSPTGVNTMMVSKNLGALFGFESLLYEKDKMKHASLRRLVGSAMSPNAIAAAIPSIQAAADAQIAKILSSETIVMDDVCNDFTLDVAWKTILGLDLKEDEIQTFHSMVKGWISGSFNPFFLLPFRFPFMKQTKSYKGHQYLVAKVEDKLADLEKNGPDGSTLSAMYFAEDAEDDSKRLTRQQVIDNSLLLIVAGSETSASTLTCASLILGLHPDVWAKVKEEQQTIQAKYGDDLTKPILDECTYLESVLKETLRIKPIDGMELRKTEKTLVIDGKQIPKGWFIYTNVKATHVNDPVLRTEDESHMDVRDGFDPDRWSDGATKPSIWIPFGEGRRRCLGERLALTEMKIFLATLARKVDYDLANIKSSDDAIKWKKMTFMARPLDGAEIKPRAAVPI
jgi:pentalenene oxygenase